MEYDNNLRGALWRNDNRTTEKHPQMKGNCEIDGKQYYVSAWTSKEGGKKPLVSLSFTLKDQVVSEPAQPVVGDDFADDIPF
jgi:hypothetical protein